MLLREAHRDSGIAAECLRSFVLSTGDDDDTDFARALAGAALIAEGLHELRNIRRLLTPRE